MLTRGHHEVITFAFAQQEMLAEEEVCGTESALCIAFANVVYVDAASFDIFSTLSLRWTKTGEHEQFNERNRAFELRLFNVFCRDFANDVVEGAFGDSLQPSAKENFAGADGFSSCGWAVDQVGHCFGQRLVCCASFRLLQMLLFEGA